MFLQYIPDHKLNYSIKNQELRLTPNDSTKVEELQIQRQFLVLMDGTEIPISRNFQKE